MFFNQAMQCICDMYVDWVISLVFFVYFIFFLCVKNVLITVLIKFEMFCINCDFFLMHECFVLHLFNCDFQQVFYICIFVLLWWLWSRKLVMFRAACMIIVLNAWLQCNVYFIRLFFVFYVLYFLFNVSSLLWKYQYCVSTDRCFFCIFETVIEIIVLILVSTIFSLLYDLQFMFVSIEYYDFCLCFNVVWFALYDAYCYQLCLIVGSIKIK